MFRRLILFSVLTICLSADAVMKFDSGMTLDNEHEKMLAKAKTTIDSINVLYDLFDRTSWVHKEDIGTAIYYMAQSLNRPDIQLDILRHLGPIFEENDSMMNVMISEAESFRTTNDQLETVTYLKMLRAAAAHPIIDEVSNPTAIIEIIKDIPPSEPRTAEEINDRIVQLFTVATHLGTAAKGDLQSNILNQLENLINRLPLQMPTIKYAYYTLAARLYIMKGDNEKAIETDMKLLKTIDDLELHYSKIGRSHRNLNMARFYSLRRLLSNYKALPIEKVDSLYEEVMRLTRIDSDVHKAFDPSQRSVIFHHLAHGRYAEAVPLILRHLDNVENTPYRTVLLRELVNGAKLLNDPELLKRANDRYIAHLENRLQRSADENEASLQILLGMNDINKRNAELEMEKAKIENDALRHSRIIFMVVTPILILLLAFALVVFAKMQKKARELDATNRDLNHQRDLLKDSESQLIEARDQAREANRKRTEYISYMAHELRQPIDAVSDYSRLIADCVDPKQKPYLEKYIHLIEDNNDLINNIINNVVSLGASDNGTLDISMAPTSVKYICQSALQNGRHYLNSATKMELIAPEGADFNITTDGSQAEACLMYLLNNAAKFTDEGKITLEYRKENGDVVFTVTDTGKGVPKDKAERVFERFFKLAKTVPGAGLGLTVCRAIVTKLGGKVWCDTTLETSGSRFIMTLPTNPTAPKDKQ